jgi:hypothetical protein
MTKNKNLGIFSQTTKTYELIIKDTEYNRAKDITGWTVYFTCKENMADIDDNAKIKKDITIHSDPTNGKTLIELTASDTNLIGSYHYDIKYKDDEDNTGILYRGRINFSKPVTIRG